ncbi:hypothetical protein [Candidatus Oscillochloris fontis]|uniref:hypothetical protein n=1 Tax=Candidatus Oscillochloris fontis TaxID=2496868 RepID=UPI00101D89F3|nr:hypothetical protein [Candidatus Oscillochloris fontis]
MTVLMLDLPSEILERLHAAALREGKSVDILAGEWLIERLIPTPPKSDRERARDVLRTAGLLIEPTPTMHAIAAQSTATLEAVQASFARIGGTPLSQIVIEQRGTKG